MDWIGLKALFCVDKIVKKIIRIKSIININFSSYHVICLTNVNVKKKDDINNNDNDNINDNNRMMMIIIVIISKVKRVSK